MMKLSRFIFIAPSFVGGGSTSSNSRGSDVGAGGGPLNFNDINADIERSILELGGSEVVAAAAAAAKKKVRLQAMNEKNTATSEEENLGGFPLSTSLDAAQRKEKKETSSSMGFPSGGGRGDTAPGPRLIDRLKDYKLQGYWVQAYKLFTRAHFGEGTDEAIGVQQKRKKPLGPSRWEAFHYKLLVELLGEARKPKEIVKVWGVMRKRGAVAIDEYVTNTVLTYLVPYTEKKIVSGGGSSIPSEGSNGDGNLSPSGEAPNNVNSEDEGRRAATMNTAVDGDTQLVSAVVNDVLKVMGQRGFPVKERVRRQLNAVNDSFAAVASWSAALETLVSRKAQLMGERPSINDINQALFYVNNNRRRFAEHSATAVKSNPKKKTGAELQEDGGMLVAEKGEGKGKEDVQGKEKADGSSDNDIKDAKIEERSSEEANQENNVFQEGEEGLIPVLKILDYIKSLSIQPTCVTYGRLMGLLSPQQQWELGLNVLLPAAREILVEQPRTVEDLSHNMLPYNILLRVLLQARQFKNMDKVFNEIMSSEALAPSTKTMELMMYRYERCGDWKSVVKIFDELKTGRGVPGSNQSYSALIRSLQKSRETERIVSVFEQMQAEGFQGNESVTVALVNAWSSSSFQRGRPRKF